MNLNLVYVPGISDVDTLNFANKNDRDTYFDNLDILFVSVPTFYPPHYTNLIKIDVDDMDFNSEVNYLWFEYNNMRYFYFIDSISYVSENVISLSITMDTYITYFPNLVINYAHIERKFIPRYINDSINRGYIRENLSKADFVLSKYKMYTKPSDWSSNAGSSDECIGHFITLSADKLGDKDTTLDSILERFAYDTTLFSTDDLKGYSAAFKWHATPISSLFTDNYIDDLRPGKYIRKMDDTSNEGDVCGMATAGHNGRIPAVYSIFFIPFNVLRNQLYIENNIIYYDDSYLSYSKIIESSSSVPSVGVFNPPNSSYPLVIYSNYLYDAVVTEFTVGTTFNYTRVPALLDENYIRYTFGDGEVESVMPLYNITSTTFYAVYSADVINGARMYMLYSANTNISYSGSFLSLPDKLCSKVINSTPIVLPIIEDPESKWFANNGATIPVSLAMTAANVYTSYASSAKSLASTRESLSTEAEYYSRMSAETSDPGYHRSYLTKALDSRDRLELMKKEKPKASANYNDSSLLGAANAMFAPHMIKSTGSLNIDIFSESIWPVLRKYMVQDIEACAHYYHLYGYKVDEIYLQSDLINYISTRRYFNYIKVRDIDMSLNVLTSDTILSELASRFKKGLRLWNPAYTIGSNLHLDNTEVA